MAENILTIFIYILGTVICVTIMNLCAALFQLIEDIPSIRKKIWTRKLKVFNGLHRVHG